MRTAAKLRLNNARLDDGSIVDVIIEGERITAVEPSEPSEPFEPFEPVERTEGAVGLDDVAPGDEGGLTSVDLSGHLLLAAPVEPHAHLDKALTADRVANPTGDLGGAIAAWLAHRATITKADFVARATEAAELSARNGCTALRTHVDLGVDIGTVGVEALLQVKVELAWLIDLQLVGLPAGITGPGGAEQLKVMREALDLGLDVVGGVPHIEADRNRAIDLLLELAGEYGCPVDVHADENLDPMSSDLETLARRVVSTGFEQSVVASHCVALGMKPEPDQDRIAELVAEAKIAVVTLPQTNLYLQARGVATAPPRGLTGLAALARAGVIVAGGGDNLRDPFCPVGRGDPMETASLLVMAGHLTPAGAYRSVSRHARAAMGLELVEVAPGRPAELVAIPAASIGEAVAAAPAGRVVVRAGRIVSDPA